MIMAVKVTVVDPLGLHLRNAARLVLLVGQYDCDVVVQNGIRQADARSILSLMALGAAKGTELEFAVEGNEAGELLESLRDFFKDDTQ